MKNTAAKAGMEDIWGVEIKVILERTIESMWEKLPHGDWALNIDGTFSNY